MGRKRKFILIKENSPEVEEEEEVEEDFQPLKKIPGYDALAESLTIEAKQSEELMLDGEKEEKTSSDKQDELPLEKMEEIPEDKLEASPPVEPEESPSPCTPTPHDIIKKLEANLDEMKKSVEEARAEEEQWRLLHKAEKARADSIESNEEKLKQSCRYFDETNRRLKQDLEARKVKKKKKKKKNTQAVIEGKTDEQLIAVATTLRMEQTKTSKLKGLLTASEAQKKLLFKKMQESVKERDELRGVVKKREERLKALSSGTEEASNIRKEHRRKIRDMENWFDRELATERDKRKDTDSQLRTLKKLLMTCPEYRSYDDIDAILSFLKEVRRWKLAN